MSEVINVIDKFLKVSHGSIVLCIDFVHVLLNKCIHTPVEWSSFQENLG